MKIQNIVLLSLSTLVMSCATSIPYTNAEFCAIENQKFSSLQKQEVVSIVHSPAERSSILTRDERMVTNCEAAKTAQEKQEIQNLRAEVQPKLEFNQSFWKKSTAHEQALADSEAIMKSQRTGSSQATFPKNE